MRIAAFPAGGESTASSRIRVFTLVNSLRALGHEAVVGDARDADVLFIQKSVDGKLLRAAQAARSRGAVVLYDADDIGRNLWRFVAPTRLHGILGLAHAMTTDTAGHGTIYLRDYAAPRVELLPDAIDYYPAGPQRPRITDVNPLRILWFGNAANLAIFGAYAEALASLPDVEMVVMTLQSEIAGLARLLPSVRFVPWSRDRFVETLQGCALSVLSHDGTDADRAKSNNKMIASINFGVPAIVSNTPEYERTAREAGVPHAVFSDFRGLVAAVDRLRSATAREAYLDQAQPVIWRRYSPDAVARRFLEIVEAVRGSTHSSLPALLPWLSTAARGNVAMAAAYELKQRFTVARSGGG